MICATLKSDSKINNHIPDVHLDKTVFLKNSATQAPRVPACPQPPLQLTLPNPEQGLPQRCLWGRLCPQTIQSPLCVLGRPPGLTTWRVARCGTAGQGHCRPCCPAARHPRLPASGAALGASVPGPWGRVSPGLRASGRVAGPRAWAC